MVFFCVWHLFCYAVLCVLLVLQSFRRGGERERDRERDRERERGRESCLTFIASGCHVAVNGTVRKRQRTITRFLFFASYSRCRESVCSV